MFLLLWMSVILLLSVMPVSGPKIDLPTDKIVHFLIYGITAMLLFRYFNKKSDYRKAMVLSFLTASAYGALLEVLQHFMPYRAFSVGDIASNTAGAFLFSFIYAQWKGR